MKRKWTFKQFYLLSFVLCLLFLTGGCEEGLTSQQIQLVTSQMQQLSTKVDDFQKTSTETIKQLEISGLVSKEVITKTEKINTEIDKVQDQQTELAKAINEVQYGDDGVVNLIKAAQAGNAASSPWNPYAAPIAAILTIAEAATLIFLKKKSNEATDSQHTNNKVIASVDSLLTSPLVTDPEKAKELLAEKQGSTVAATVKTIKNS